MKVKKFRTSEIIIWNGNAYIPSNAYYRDGIFTSIEPVYVANPAQDELVPIVQAILSKEPVLLPDPTPEDIRTQRDLLPRITGARSWKRLCQYGISYIIELSKKGFLLEMSRLDKRGRWEFDPDKRKTYPRNTDLVVIIQDVLNDLAERPQAKDEGNG